MLNFILGYLILSLVIFIGVSLYVLIHEGYIREVMLIAFLWWIVYPVSWAIKLINKAYKKRVVIVSANTANLSAMTLHYSNIDVARYNIQSGMKRMKYRKEALGIDTYNEILYRIKFLATPVNKLQDATDRYFLRDLSDKLEKEALRESYSGDLR